MDEGVDLIIDFIGKNYFTPNLNTLRRDGTLVFLAFMSGPTLGPDANIAQILFKRLTLKGSTLRSRTQEYQADLLQRFKDNALDKIRQGDMRVEVHEVSSTMLVTRTARLTVAGVPLDKSYRGAEGDGGEQEQREGEFEPLQCIHGSC